MREADDWHQEPLGAESYESEHEGDESSEDDREGAPQADMDTEQRELSVGCAPSTPEKTGRPGGHQFGERSIDMG